jgi:hypothetical protein
VWGNEERDVKEPEKLWLRSMRIVTTRKRQTKGGGKHEGLFVGEEIDGNDDCYMDEKHEEHAVWSYC